MSQAWKKTGKVISDQIRFGIPVEYLDGKVQKTVRCDHQADKERF